MKISKYLGTFALLAMLAACSTEDEQVRFAGDEVKVNATWCSSPATSPARMASPGQRSSARTSPR
jgi:uncharacterized lipoprotein